MSRDMALCDEGALLITLYVGGADDLATLRMVAVVQTMSHADLMLFELEDGEALLVYPYADGSELSFARFDRRTSINALCSAAKKSSMSTY